MKIDIKKLKKCREKAGFTQKEIAKRIGVSDSSYQYYELGIRNPKANTVNRIEFVIGDTIALPDEENVQSLINSIVFDMKEAKKILNVDEIGDMKVNDIINMLNAIK